MLAMRRVARPLKKSSWIAKSAKMGRMANTLIRVASLLAFSLWLYGSTGLAVEDALPTDVGVPQFEQDIRPILAARCFECHGADDPEAKLDLRTVTAMLRGGTAGPVIVRGYPARSELLEKISSGAMPPAKDNRLSAEEVALIRRWILHDAPAKENTTEPVSAALVTPEERRHWAYQSPVWHEPPRVRWPAKVRRPVDAFVLAKLDQMGLTLAPDADRETLVRRVFLDLVGLLPTPEQVEEFLADERPDAYEGLVDMLLSSPHFGERWGRHWLDAAGYVDVYGGDNDAAIINVLDSKWRYRDYVIRSLNHDKPFDRFITEQLAGDELVDWRSAEPYTAEVIESLTATGFLLAAADDTHAPELNTADIRHRVLQLTVEIVASNLLAMTLQCAKCHDHKYEAIPQRDYYRLLATFAPAFNPDHWVVSNARGIPDVAACEKAEIDRHNAEILKRVASRKQCQSSVRDAYQQRLFAAKLSKLPAVIQQDVKTALSTAAGDRSAVQKYLAERLGPLLEVDAEEITSALSQQDRQRLDKLDREIAELNAQQRRHGVIQAVYEANPPTPTYLLRRGNHLSPGIEVRPGLPAVLTEPEGPIEASALLAGSSSGRRLRLARQLTDPNALAGGYLARVMVNRLWQQLFGRGIVATSDNFGVSGSDPTHPELLDWLALEFIRCGWKMKPVIRMLVTSSTYRQASANPSSEAVAAEVDPANVLLWKMRLRRLESEILRDAILTVSDQLVRDLGGPPTPLAVEPDGRVVIDEQHLSSLADKWRRSIYVLARRNYQLSLLATFDQPVVATNCTRRSPSAVVTQSLTMLNDAFVLEHARGFAERLAGSRDVHQQIDQAFRIALGRRPLGDEILWCQELLQCHTERYYQSGLPREAAGRRALTHLCQVLLNTSEFLYVR